MFGVMTDKIGRKPTFFVANLLMAGGGILAALAPNLPRLIKTRGCDIIYIIWGAVFGTDLEKVKGYLEQND